ncbi:MAG: FtsX-like permease family protein [Bacteroidales bacterium]|nr:FtsX-like permease family protein [Bacteroidales bacterium]
MSLSSFIARRYLFSKKSHNAINIISGIAAGGIAIATAAMVCTLSVFNGFHDLISTLYCNFDPEIQVTAAQGKTFSANDPVVKKMQQHPGVEAASVCLEDNALILFRGHPLVITIKGVDEKFDKVTSIREILYGDGSYRFEGADLHYGIPGIGLANQMGGPDYGSLQICAPRGGERINLANPIESFSVEDLQSPKVVFNVNQRKYDENFILTSLQFAQTLFEKPNVASSLEIKVKPTADIKSVKNDIKQMGGAKFTVRDRMEQQADVFNIMNIEKLIAYIFLTFIVLIACFNIISSLFMLIIEKKEDVTTLRNLGLSNGRIRSIFMIEGRLISIFGAIIGIVLGVVLCLLQEHFGLIRLGNNEGSFIVSAYPVAVHAIDIVVVFFTVLIVGFVSVWYPVHALSKRLLD